MKVSLITATLLLTGSLYALNTNKLSATQEGVIAVKLFDTVLKASLTKQLQVENNTTAIEACITAADKTMEKMNNELPAYVKMSLGSLDAKKTSHATDLEIMRKYQKDIKNKTGGSMIITTAKVGDTTRVYKPLVIDKVWLQCHDDKTDVNLGDFKGVIISEISKR